MLHNGKVVETHDDDATILLYSNLDEAERNYLVETLKIDEHTLGSTQDPQEVARVEFEPDHAAIIFKRPKRYTAADNFLFKVVTSGVFLFADKVVVIGEELDVLFEGRHFGRVQNIQDFLLRVLYQSVLHFTDHLKVMNTICDDLEDKVNKAMENRHLLHMFTIEKGLVYYLNAISSNGRVLDKLKSNATRLHFETESLEWLDDLMIENAQCLETANTHAQVLASLMDARASLVSNNLNVMMKNLNAIVIAVAVPSFFASMGGMSEFSAMFNAEHWTFAYPLFFATMVGIGVATFFVIRKIERYWKR
jgi:magnesium transporter